MPRTTEREQFLADIITTAIEGGTGYWATVYRYKWDDLPPAEVHAWIVDNETVGTQPAPPAYEAWLSEHARVINVELIARGISRIASGRVPVALSLQQAIVVGNRDVDAGMIDADCADVIVQAGLFGEIVYG